jgi:putative FmdB family regulatory protein
MPTYSYRCTACDNAFDVSQSFTDDALTECPACEGRLRKIFSVTGVTFNGSGFYRTDSRAAQKESGSKESGSKQSGSSTSGDSSSSGGAGGSSGSSGSSSVSTSTPATTAAAS